MIEPDDTKADCYSATERSAMEVTQQWRGWLLRPTMTAVAAWGVTADHVTAASLVAGLTFCPLFIWSKPAALVMLALHILLDGVDGTLARHTGTTSRRGSFTDSVSDQIVVVATTVTLMATPQHIVGIWPGGLYVFVYTMVVAFAMVRNALAVPYSWVVRPRFIVYAWFVIELYLVPGTIDYVLWLFNGLLAWKMATGFLRIRRKI
jgi:phosphatidylglycerophosphate synthase